MKSKQSYLKSSLAVAMAIAGLHAGLAQAENSVDFGARIDHALSAESNLLFGIIKPIEDSAPNTAGPYRTLAQVASDHVLLAKGLTAEYLTRNAADNTDMMAFFPAANPTHLITCVEEDVLILAPGKLNPSVQSIDLANGNVTTILRGMKGCDGIRTTPWGTIVATEETTDGAAYEILSPLTTTNETVINRSTGTVTNPALIAKRSALPTMAWEGLEVLPSGVVIAGDELRPGSPADRDGGAIFKFVPSVPRATSSTITTLAQSPLVAGSVYAMQVSCVNNTQQFGQGCEIGNAAWVSVNAATARLDAHTNGATGFYRPEDLQVDPMFITDAANPGAVRFCWANTGNESGKNYAEVVCAVDKVPLTASATQRTVVANRFVEGDTDFNSFDNLEFQPKINNLYVIEDHPNGDIFACLADGADRDIKTDGCVKILSVKDSSAEPTGFIFTADGETAYVSIQHTNDANMPLVDGYPTDDVIKISGFKVK